MRFIRADSAMVKKGDLQFVNTRTDGNTRGALKILRHLGMALARSRTGGRLMEDGRMEKHMVGVQRWWVL